MCSIQTVSLRPVAITWPDSRGSRPVARTADMGSHAHPSSASGSCRSASPPFPAEEEANAERALRQPLLQPLLLYIAKYQRRVIGPDGALWLAPWPRCRGVGRIACVGDLHRLAVRLSRRAGKQLPGYPRPP